MLVDSIAAPAAAMWQGLGLIGISIWAVLLFQGYSESHSRKCNTFLVCWLVAQTALVIALFAGDKDDASEAVKSTHAAAVKTCNKKQMTEYEYFLANFGGSKCEEVAESDKR